MRTPEEQNLLDKLASGILDGMVGDEREYRRYHSIYCGKMIRNGIPILYRQENPTRFFDGQKNHSSAANREEEAFDSDERKLEFLRRYGWLIDDKEVRAYSARYKPGRNDGR